MEPRREGGARRGHWTVRALLAGAVVGLLVSTVLLLPASPAVAGTRSKPTPAPPQVGVDPQFLPQILTSTNASASGHFGESIAAQGSTVVVGAPGELGSYSGGYLFGGEVHVLNVTTGVWHYLQAFCSCSGGTFGWSVAIGGGLIVVGAPGEGYGTSDVYSVGRVFVFNASTLHPMFSLESPNALEWYSSSLGRELTDDFGASVAVSSTASGDLIVVGAPGENSSGYPFGGHAYVINARNDATIELSSPYPEGAALFGDSVAISGTTVLVGASGQGLLGFGGAYVFSALTGDLLTSLVSPHATEGGSFGASVALNGTIAVVGAPGEGQGGLESPNTQPAGDAYEFNLASDSVTELTGTNNTSDGHFGASVAVTSSEILVGAPHERPFNSSGSGNAYLFSTASGALIRAVLSAPDWPTNAGFGAAVALNNVSVVYVGAPGENASDRYGAGHAFIFSQVPLTVSSPNAISGGCFGCSVSIGNGSIGIGAPNETVNSLTDAGRAYYLPNDHGPVQALSSPAPTANGEFGFSVATSGTLLAVGAPGQNKVWIYHEPSGALNTSVSAPSGGRMGASVAVSGNLVAMGAPNETIDSLTGMGEVFVKNLSSGTLDTIIDPWPQAGAQFGSSVAIWHNTLVVGAPGQTSGVGGVYAFNLTGALNKPYTNVTDYAPGGRFGTSVAVSGSTVVVGAPNATAVGIGGAGRVFTYKRETNVSLTSLTSPNPVGGGHFGESVATNGATIVVGAPGESSYGVSGAGVVYLFPVGSLFPSDSYYAEPPVLGGFGSAVAVGPIGRVVVGEPTGNAYIFTL